MNTKLTKEFFENRGVVALRADKGVIPHAVEEKLTELGNPEHAIPFYAVYGPAVNEPVTFSAFITRGQVKAAIEKAGGKSESPEIAAKSGDMH